MSRQNEKSCHKENFRILIENWIDFTSSGTEFRLGIRYVNGCRNINPVKLIPISCECPYTTEELVNRKLTELCIIVTLE